MSRSDDIDEVARLLGESFHTDDVEPLARKLAASFPEEWEEFMDGWKKQKTDEPPPEPEPTCASLCQAAKEGGCWCDGSALAKWREANPERNPCPTEPPEESTP